jgi:hypothetical protein
MRSLAQNEDFRECVSLTDRALEEQYDMDLVLRFIVFRQLQDTALRQIGDINEFLTNTMIEMITERKIDVEEEARAFAATFRILREKLGSDSFHRYDPVKDRFMGGFLISAYELVALGVGYNYKSLLEKDLDIASVTKSLWMTEDFTSRSGSGVRASSRIPTTLPLGRDAFKP